MRVAILGPGAVGGFLAAALDRAGTDATVVAREETAERIARDGIRVQSVRLGEFSAHPAAAPVLDAPVDVLVIAVKAPVLAGSLERVRTEPALVVPLLNGLEHVDALRARFGARAVAGSIRIAAERPRPGEVLHTSPGVRVELAPATDDVEAFAHVLRAAEVPAKVLETEAQVLWSKLARLNPLAALTSAADTTIGAVRGHPAWRARLEGAVDETVAVAAAEGVPIDAGRTLAELMGLDPDHDSSLHRDLVAGIPSELDAICGAVQRAGARHGVATPTVDALVTLIRERYPGA